MSYDTLISPTELQEIAGDQRTVIVDCRFSLLDPAKGRNDYETDHIPTAVYADLDRDLAGPVTAETGRHPLPAVETFVQTLRGWGISNDSQVVVYDDGSGGLAARLWWMLRWLGHNRVAVLDGGYAAWKAADMPVSPETPAPASGTFTGSPVADMTISASEVAERLESADGYILVDAREAGRFRGDAEPIDPVAGHVPGALNLPFSSAISEAGVWRSPEELKALWQAHIPDQDRFEWAVMCGSGVTACHLALSAQVAGRAEPRLYVGSWSGWLRNPERPVATGAD